MAYIRCVSMQSTSQLGVDIDCKFISENFPTRSIYNPNRPHKIALFLQDSKTRFILFSKLGKMVMFGGNSIEANAMECSAMVEELRNWGSLYQSMETIHYLIPKITYLVASGFLGKKINLFKFSVSEYEDDITLETDIFPGLRIRHIHKSNAAITSTIYASGKLIITGSKTEQEIDESFIHLKKITEKFLF
jgi:TATA-box binding protein (TBP) (component of TFIID and TFIIIB)